MMAVAQMRIRCGPTGLLGSAKTRVDRRRKSESGPVWPDLTPPTPLTATRSAREKTTRGLSARGRAVQAKVAGAHGLLGNALTLVVTRHRSDTGLARLLEYWDPMTVLQSAQD